MQNIVEGWSRPEVILVVTNLLEWPSAMPHALRQAKLSGAAVLLAYVVSPSSMREIPKDGSSINLQGDTVGSIQTTLNQMAAIFQREGVSCETVILRGPATEQIRLLVESRKIDRVIIASSSPKGVARLLVGSPAEEMASALNVPVCIVGPEAYIDPLRDTGPVQIIAATTFEPDGLLCALFASKFTEANSGCLTLLHVVNSKETNTTFQKSSHREFENYLASQAPNRCQAHIAVRRGDSATEILNMALSLSAHFIVMSSPRDAAVSRILCDSIVHRVVRESRCPVITVRTDALGESRCS